MNNSNQFAATFLQEAAEQLALIEEIILEIEANPQDIETVNRLFRVFHTIKGSGAMFGFDQVAGFTHHVETVLDKVRNGQVPVSKELVDLILAAKDQITMMLDGPSAPSQQAKQAEIIARLNALLPGAAPAKVTAATPAQVAPSAAPAVSPLTTFRIGFCPDPGIMSRGMDPAMLLADLRALGSCVITAKTDAIPPLEQLTPDFCGFSWEIVLKTDRTVNAIKDVFIFVEDESKITIETLPDAPVSENTSNAELAKPVASAECTTLATTKVEPAKPNVPAGNGKPAASAKANGNDGSVRVPSERLNRLVNLVGELVINQSRLAQVANRLGITELDAPAEDLERLVAELRDIVLGIRMMPIGTTFSRFKRLVRDLSAELGKEIDLVAEGAETELDKTVIDQLGDPLVHLIRNSIDHGISTPEERLSEGKPRRGTIRLIAMHEGAHVTIKIDDDGRGLNKDAIRAKAIERKLIAPDAVMSDKELYNLIFLPGFSTAKTVTSVSGRGVGMDVVKRQIDALRGSVDINSKVGKGTCITLTLPLTLAIIDGLLVEVNREQFIVPMSSVMENVELTATQRATNNGRNLLAVRGELIPYLRLRDIFGITGSEMEVERVVIVNLGGNRIGLVVDRILGSHQTVIQSLGRFYQNIEVVSGATIMGDGRVALILDVAGLVQKTNLNISANNQTTNNNKQIIPLQAA
jgi:two-component system chemotaxis sensor kinase CheA